MGLGHVKADIPHPAEEVDEYARFGLFMAEFLYAWSLGMSKLAILCFYLRLFSVSNIRPGIYILGACTIIWLTIRTLRSQSCCCLCSRWPVLDFARVKNLLLWPCSCSVSCTSFSTSCFLLCYATFVHHWLTRSCSVCAASIVVLIVAINLNAKTTEMSRDVKGVIIWAGTESYLAIISCEYFRNPKWPAF